MRFFPLILLAVVSSVRAEEPSKRLVLTAENAEVVVAPGAPSGALFAATELTNFLSRVFALSVPLVRSATPGKVPVHVGDGPAARIAGVDVAKLPDDAFALKVDASGVVIAGLDDPEIDMFNRVLWGGNSQRFPHATVFGVYEFLERFAGCRFYFPGRLGEIVPRRKSLTLAFGDYGSAPDFKVRYYSHMDGSLGAWPERDRMTETEWRIATNLELYRLRMETHYVPFCHGQRLIGLSERFAKTHPEWFAMRANGKRSTEYDPNRPSSSSQMCLTSGYWEEIYQDAKSYLSGEPPSVRKPAKAMVKRNGKLVEEYVWLWHAKHGKYFDVMPNDGIAKCACPNCSAAFARAKDPENYWATEIVWGRTVEMANRLKAEGVGGYLTQMAYGAYSAVPDFEIPTNVLVMLARTGAWSVPNRAKWEKENELVKAWSEKTHGNLCLWNYPGKYDCAGTTIPDVPSGTPHAMGAYLKSVAPWIIGAYQESETDRFLFNYLTLYVFSRIAWNRRYDPEKVIAEHNRLMFGKAAKTMGAYIRIQEDIWLTNVVGNVVDTQMGPKAMVPSEYELWTRIYGDETVARLSRLLDRAEREAGRDTIEAERIRLYRAETLAPLAARRTKYLEAVLPEREFAYRRAHPVPPERALVPNGDFEKWISPWRRNTTTEDGVVEWDAKEGVDGPGCLRLFTSCLSKEGGWKFTWRVNAALFLDEGKVRLKPLTRYRLSYFVKTDNVVALDGRGGAVAAIIGTDGSSRFFPEKRIRGTLPWTRQAFEFETGPNVGKERPTLRLAISKACGEAWFDGVRLDELGPAASSSACVDPELVHRAAAEAATPILPGWGRHFWNPHAWWYTRPPAFAFTNLTDAASYRFRVTDGSSREHVFTAATPQAPLTPVWTNLPSKGMVSVVCRGLDAKGADVGLAGSARFWKNAPFVPQVRDKDVPSYAEMARRANEYVFGLDHIRRLSTTGKIDYSYRYNCYPTKMVACIVEAAVREAVREPALKSEMLKLARAAADALLAIAEPADAPLAHFTPTYAAGNTNYTAGKYAGQHMLIYPASGAWAFLSLYRATHESKYLAAAEDIAGTYLRLQGSDGTWSLKMWAKDGTSIGPNRLFPMSVCMLLEALYAETGKTAYRAAADRGFEFVEKGPLADWNWEGQFEDVEPAEKYVNLTKHSACDTALYLLRRYPGDAVRLAQARALLDFADDQFVAWERPCSDDGSVWAGHASSADWTAFPAVMEQYRWFVPTDSSSAKMIRTYLAFHAATGDRLALAKAQALGDAYAKVQQPNGRIPTQWMSGGYMTDPQYDWINCMLASAAALDQLADAAK